MTLRFLEDLDTIEEYECDNEDTLMFHTIVSILLDLLIHSVCNKVFSLNSILQHWGLTYF
ncbi:unnamed protein product [Trichobilharzia regenti]|nr:unnamed protein product [Trichobilharzia regenti]